MDNIRRTMENTAGDCRRFPPRSKFNDEESTAVLRLIVEQERLLKNSVNPVLNITSDKLKRLPPLGRKSENHAQLDCSAFEPQRTQRRPKSDEDIVLSRPTLLKGKDLRGTEEPAALGRPKIPEIYSTPKIARPRERERPRASYGRNTQIRSNSTEPHARAISDHRSFVSDELPLNRPSNPTPLIEYTDDLMNQGNSSRTVNSDSFGYESDEDQLNIEEAYVPYIN